VGIYSQVVRRWGLGQEKGSNSSEEFYPSFRRRL